MLRLYSLISYDTMRQSTHGAAPKDILFFELFLVDLYESILELSYHRL